MDRRYRVGLSDPSRLGVRRRRRRPVALEGEPDEEVWAATVADDRALVSENVQDFRRLEADALARAQPRGPLIYTTDRQFPRGDPATIGPLVTALDALLSAEPNLATALFLKPA